ncbi:MAG: GNAT family N-acetyltransferase, partial [Parvularculaceae bacterium]
RLVGLAPLAPMKGYARLPVRYLASWMHEHCFYGAPLVRRGFEAGFFDALFRLAAVHPARPAFIRLRHINAEGPLAAAAHKAAEASGRISFQSGAHERALLKCGYRADDYLAKTIRKKKRKEMDRLRRRLKERGDVVMKTLDDARDLPRWRDDFLRLESAGWKGRDGSALAASEVQSGFFSDVLDGAFDAKSLRFYRLEVGERTIAMIVNFIAGGEGFSFKIAHDPDFARYSPGVMLEIEMLRALEDEPGLRFVDSCASADHPMINSLWADRRAIVGLNISGPRPRHRAILGACCALEGARERFAALRERS